MQYNRIFFFKKKKKKKKKKNIFFKKKKKKKRNFAFKILNIFKIYISIFLVSVIDAT